MGTETEISMKLFALGVKDLQVIRLSYRILSFKEFLVSAEEDITDCLLPKPHDPLMALIGSFVTPKAAPKATAPPPVPTHVRTRAGQRQLPPDPEEEMSNVHCSFGSNLSTSEFESFLVCHGVD